MRKNFGLLCVFLFVMVGGLAIGLWVVHQNKLKLVAEQQTLKQQLEQMTALAGRNEQLSNLLAQASVSKPLPSDQLIELLRLRGEVSVLSRRQAALDINKAREENRQMHAVLDRYRQTLAETNAKATANYWPRDTWANSGYGSPEAALQTIFWAGNNGDFTNFFASIADEARDEVRKGIKGKSPEEISAGLADETRDLQSIQILDREWIDENTVSLTVELEKAERFSNLKIIMKRNGDGWRFAGPQR
ncbi:MAG TPA: hypothetical protein VF988_17600 [Verrucomicrobiae bacterium]